MPKDPIREDLVDAATTLAHTERGRQCLLDLMAMLDNGADGLDIENQMAVITLLLCQFGPFAGSTREEIKRALGGIENYHDYE